MTLIEEILERIWRHLPPPKSDIKVYLQGVKTGWWLCENQAHLSPKDLKQNYGIDAMEGK